MRQMRRAGTGVPKKASVAQIDCNIEGIKGCNKKKNMIEVTDASEFNHLESLPKGKADNVRMVVQRKRNGEYHLQSSIPSKKPAGTFTNASRANKQPVDQLNGADGIADMFAHAEKASKVSKKISKMKVAGAGAGAVLSVVSAVTNAKAAIEKKDPVSAAKAGASIVQAGAQTGNLVKVATKGVASKTAAKIGAGVAVVTTAIDIVETLNDGDLDGVDKALFTALDVSTAALSFCGPIGIVASIGVGIAGSLIKDAIKEENRKKKKQ